ncbi:MAG: hypothetical protein ABFS32_04960 [Bacteroidota bacterium]
MHIYRVLYNGYGANRAFYREQELRLELRHNWSKNDDEAARVFYLVHQKLKEHFAKYDLLLVEKLR